MKTLYAFLIVYLVTSTNLFGATFRNYVGNTNPANGTLIIWINSDTVPQEGVIAQLRYNSGSGDQFTGFVSGTFDNTGFAGANWRVTFNGLNLPAGNYRIFIELANTNQSGQSYGFTGFNDTNSFSRSGLALPVTLASFNAKANANKMASLDWVTVSETNNAGFEVERSADALAFARIGKVTGRGTTNLRQQYNFTDEAPLSGVNYYRLKQTDTDGAFSYSPVRAVIIRGNGELTILGNPAATDLSVAGLIPGSTAELIDLLGQVRHRQVVTQPATRFDVSMLPTGTYLLRVAEATGVLSKRVLISR